MYCDWAANFQTVLLNFMRALVKSSHGDVTKFYMAYAAKFQFEPTLISAALRMSGSFARFGCMYDFTKEFGRKCQVVI